MYYQTRLNTKLGPMIAIGNNETLALLEFTDCKDLNREINDIKRAIDADILSGYTASTRSIERELTLYFDGKLKEFKTPLSFFGTPFQKRVWEELCRVPYGETRSYASIATAIGKPSAFRAVARANGANKLAIIVPCHRVINSNGSLGGYAGGITRKQQLLALEATIN